MTANQLREYAAENCDDPKQVLREVLQEVIDEKGLIWDTTFKEAVQTYYQLIERKLKQRCYE